MLLLKALLVALLAPADPTPAPVPAAPPVIELPISPVIPAPMPSTPTMLLEGEQYVIKCRAKCRVAMYPKGIVTIVSKTGPRDITGKFAGGGGKEEDKTFDAPMLLILKPVKSGQVLVEFTPYGFAKDEDVVQVNLDVKVGPLPDPVVPPVVPPTPVDPVQTAAQAAFDKEPASSIKAIDKADFASALRLCSIPDNWSNVNTAGDVVNLVHNETERRIGKRLMPLRSLVGTELGKGLPTDRTAVLTKQQKTDAGKQLERLAGVVDAVK